MPIFYNRQLPVCRTRSQQGLGWDRVCEAQRSNESPSGAFKRQRGLRQQMEGRCPDKLGGICDKGYHGLQRASRWFCKFSYDKKNAVPKATGTAFLIFRHSASSVPEAPVGWHGTAPAHPHRSSYRGHPPSQRLWRLHRTSIYTPRSPACAVTAGSAG